MKGKLRHVAIQCADPAGSAEFYKTMFGMQEMNRIGLEGDAEGAIYLSDGVMNLALIHITRPDFPNYRPLGLNHIGFIVEDLGQAVAAAEVAGAHTVCTGHEIVEGEFWEHKIVGPDGVGIDLYDVQGRGWPGIGALSELGVTGAISGEQHQSGRSLTDTDRVSGPA